MKQTTERAMTLLLMILQLLVLNQQAFAQPPASGSSTTNAVNLDLSSTHASLPAAALGLSNAVNIRVGTKLDAVNLSSVLTPAELVAAYQVATLGNQTLKLTAQGNAVGGTFSIPVPLSKSLGNLVVPQGVKLFDNAAQSPTLSLSGNLIDAGSVIAFSTNQLVSGAIVNVSNIYIGAGGILASAAGVGAQHAVPALNLTLNALGTITNAGTISSLGSLNVSAATGNFSNSGTIKAVAGNINISAPSSTAITFNNTGGTLAAQNGAISFRDSSYVGAANLNLIGGNYLSQSLNLFSGTGAVNMSVGQVTGIVNTYAGSAQLSADTPNLQIGVFDVSGDPWINVNGNLDLGANPPTPAPPWSYLVATATGSIYASSGISIDTAASGGNVVMAAGVTATDSGGNISLARSGTGGDIVLTAGQTIDGNATQNITGFTTGGGNVTLIAMTDGKTGSTNGGHVAIPLNVTINTVGPGGPDLSGGITINVPSLSGSQFTQIENIQSAVSLNVGATGPSGGSSVTILAEASAGTTPAVSLGGISASGSVKIKSATANLAGATISDSNGAITDLTGTGAAFDSATLQSGTLSVGAVTSSGSLSMFTNGAINLGGTCSSTNALFVTSTLNFANNASVSTSNGTLGITSAVDSLIISGTSSGSASLSAVGGVISVISLDNISFVSSGSGNTLLLDSDTGVGLIAMNAMIVNQNVNVIGSTSKGAWTVTTGGLTIGAGAVMGSSNASVTINVLSQLVQNGTINGMGITIQGAGPLVMSGSGNYSAGNNTVLLNIAQNITLEEQTVINASGPLMIETPCLIIAGYGKGPAQQGATASLEGSTVTLQITPTSNLFQVGIVLGGGMDTGTLVLNSRNGPTTINGNPAVGHGLTLISTSELDINGGVIDVGNLLSYSGPIKLTADLDIVVSPNSAIYTANGSIQLSVTYPGGDIMLEPNSVIDAQGGGVSILVGTPSTASAKKPVSINTVVQNGGQIVFSGTGSITAETPVNVLGAIGETISINSGNNTSSLINLEGKVVIQSSSFPALTSLDLSNPVVAQQVVNMQKEKAVGGSLTLGSNGAAVGGTIILTPYDVAPIVTAENIPQGVTLTMTSPSGSSSLQVEAGLSQTSYGNQVLINGTENFSGSGAIVVLSTTPGDALNIGSKAVVSATGALSIAAVGNINVDGIVSTKMQLGIGTLQDFDGNANITIAGTVGNGAQSVVVLAGTGGNIIQGGSSGKISGKIVEIEALGGSVGSVTLPIVTQAGILAFVPEGSNAENIWVSNTGNLSLGNSTASGSLNLTETGNLTIVGNIQAQNSIQIVLTGSLSDQSGGLQSPTISVIGTTGGIGTASAPLLTTTSQLQVLTSGAVYVKNAGSISLSSSVANGPNQTVIQESVLSLTNNGSITTTGLVAAKTLTLQTAAGSNGNIDIQDGMGLTGDNVVLSANGSGDIEDAQSITQPSVIRGSTITLTSGSGDIGTGGTGNGRAPLILGAGSSISAHTTGNVNVDGQGALVLNTTAAGDAIVCSSAGLITVKGIVASPNVDIFTDSGSNAGITLSANVGSAQGTTAVSADGSGNVSQTAGTVIGETVNIASGTGNIGGSKALITTASNLTLETNENAASGTGVGIVNVSNNGLASLNAGSSGGNFQLSATGGLNAGNITSSNGSVVLTTSKSSMYLGGTIVAGNGNVNIVDSDTSGGSITLISGTAIHASAAATSQTLGNVNIVIGALPAPKVNTTQPANIQGSGSIYYGQNSIEAGINRNFPINTITATNKTVIFSTGKLLPSAILLEGGVNITSTSVSLRIDTTDSRESVIDTGEWCDDVCFPDEK